VPDRIDCGREIGEVGMTYLRRAEQHMATFGARHGIYVAVMPTSAKNVRILPRNHRADSTFRGTIIVAGLTGIM
jgi:hypothetical protein